MANPVVTAVPLGAWTKVATNQTAGYIWPLIAGKVQYLHTYRMTGGAAPTLITEGALMADDGLEIKAAAAVDVYLWAQVAAGSVRVDV